MSARPATDQKAERSEGGRSKTIQSAFGSFLETAEITDQTARNWQSVHTGLKTDLWLFIKN
jgi:hypothetical protein